MFKYKKIFSLTDLLLLGLLIMGATQPTNLHKRFRLEFKTNKRF